MLENFEKSIYKLCFFHTLKDAWKFFSHKYGTFSQQIATASLQKAPVQLNKAFLRRSMLLGVWSMCSSFYITRAMIGTKKTNDSLEKKKA